jgi:hypothetical protein
LITFANSGFPFCEQVAGEQHQIEEKGRTLGVRPDDARVWVQKVEPS